MTERSEKLLETGGRPPARALLSMTPEELRTFLARVAGKDGPGRLAEELKIHESDAWLLREWAKGYVIVLGKRGKEWAKAEETCSRLWRRMPPELTG